MLNNNKKIKVLCFIDSFNSGGAQKQMALISNGLTKRGYLLETLQYHPLFFFKTNLVKKNNIVSHKYSFIRYIKIIFFLIKYKPTVIISFLHGPNVLSCIYRSIFFWRPIKLILGERNYLVGRIKLKEVIKRIPYIFSSFIVCNSESQRKKISLFFGKKTLFIPNGTVDPNIKLKKFNQKNNETIRLIVPARFIDQKNPLNLLKALKHTSNIIVHWYGEIFKDYDIYGECMEYIDQNNLKNKFKLFDPVSNIYKVMIKYDAVLLPSFYEGCPNAIIDGMFCGLPILASKVSDNSIYLSHQSELLFSPSEPHEIADRLKYFSQLTLSDKAIIGENNYKSAKSFFDYPKMLDKYEKLFKND
tara:strand:- start:847 stop:1923 length:1077 start_codon:yes stop_codon:yes gene_type:complete